MNLDELRSAQSKERRKDSLQHLRDSFYDDVAAYVADLRAARDRRAEQVAKPFSDDDVRRLSDEVETAEEVAEALYERRVGKVVKLASFAAADMSVDADGMTTEERQLFDDLVDRIKGNKSRVLDVLSGEVPVGEGDPSSAETGPDPAANATADDARAASATAEPNEDPTAPSPDPEQTSGVASGNTSDATSDALAGAMGGADDAVADALDASADEAATRSDAPPSGDSPTPETSEAVKPDAAANDGPTAVPPEPAPPGAPGVDDATDVAEASPEPRSEPDGGTTVAPTETETTAAPAADADRDGDDVASDLADDAGIDDRATVRITRDVGAIFGVDEREYDLASEDVVTLPVENAEPLVQRNAAERLD